MPPHYKILLVEPLNFYLQKFSNLENVTLCNCAVGNKNGFVEIYYVEESDIEKYKLPDFIKGCNSIDYPHPITLKYIESQQLSYELIKKIKIEMIKFSDLCNKFNIESIGTLKLDTEGYEHHILPDVYKFAVTNQLKTIVVEYQKYAGNTEILDVWFELFKNIGYKITPIGNIDYKLEKG